MDSVLGYHAKGPGFNSRLKQWNSFSTTKIPFLIEDTSELECLTLVQVPNHALFKSYGHGKKSQAQIFRGKKARLKISAINMS